jgi:hypothetical protein
VKPRHLLLALGLLASAAEKRPLYFTDIIELREPSQPRISPRAPTRALSQAGNPLASLEAAVDSLVREGGLNNAGQYWVTGSAAM